MKYEKLAKDIIENIGGKENIISLAHCMTRLRFKLKDEKKAKTDILKNMNGVLTVIQSGGQYQVVIGNHVSEVYKDVVDIAGISSSASTDEVEEGKGGIFNKFIDIVAGVFTPIIGALAATGLIKGVTVLLSVLGVISNTSATYRVLYAIGDCLLYFFPIYLGYTAATKFKMKPFIGMTIGAALVYPDIVKMATEKPMYTMFAGTIFKSNVLGTFCDIPLIMMNYKSSVIPIIIATFFASKLEKKLNDIVPSVVKSVIVPTVTLLVIVPLTFIIIGPVSTWLSSILSAFSMMIYQLSPVLAGLFIGAFWQIFILFGLHWGFVPIAMNNITTLGYDSVVMLGMSVPFATSGVLLAILFKTKNKNLKAIVAPALASSIFGITEPALYGVTLPRKKPFIITIIANAIAGGLLGLFGTKIYMMGASGAFAIPSYINPKGGMDRGFYGYIIAISTAAVIGFVLTWLFGFKDEKETAIQEVKTEAELANNGVEDEVIFTPVEGEVRPLSELKDEAFASGVMGKGVAIYPKSGKIIAPTDGVITTLFPTKHAIGITTDNGAEILIHVGMDTVELNGKHFTAKIKQGDRVKKGDLLIEFDIKSIENQGYSLITPVIVTNSGDYTEVIETNSNDVINGDKLLTAVK
ncbi:beta-glucoside-specific PTS transporter subunit IIABC [Clostridium sp. C8-1-8]|uniref:beta-glucoside-specific PTS transporter subunit IIABC n=1 Tax=Clostridium sp. C8-1-8 TaxID=2698831 RepID=UPI00136D7072|nr:beta-glucoside-specific PTS transporter subunit IIABC [Clostridium sp. C8-1-8]